MSARLGLNTEDSCRFVTAERVDAILLFAGDIAVRDLTVDVPQAPSLGMNSERNETKRALTATGEAAENAIPREHLGWALLTPKATEATLHTTTVTAETEENTRDSFSE